MEKLGENIINFFSEKLEDLKELITWKTKKKLAELKASFAEKYVKKYIDDPLLKVTGIVQSYMLEKGIIGKIKNELIYEKLLEKSNLEEETKNKIKKLKDELKEVNNEEELSKIEEREINNISEPTTTEENTEYPMETTEEQKKYIEKIAWKFSEPKKWIIKKYWPIVMQEAWKYKETKNIVPKIFAQIEKESWRNPNALNDDWEYSVGLMQINKNAGHTGNIDGKYYDIDNPEWNIAYWIAYLAQCIRKSDWNIRKWFNLYNWAWNFKKREKDQYAHSIINDNQFNEKIAA